MSPNVLLLEKFKQVERLATKSKVGRLLHNPFKYMYAIVLKDFLYPRNKKEQTATTTIFTGKKMNILLPSATDIYLTGGKSHDSERRLTRFLIQTLQPGNNVLDIGAHYGFFSLVCSELIGSDGRLLAVEPATSSVTILKKNCAPFDNITVIPKAIAEKTTELFFHEFPNLYSEYNAIDADQFKNEEWYREFEPVKTRVEATSVNDLTKELNFIPQLIKIDVEGAELKVIQGGYDFFALHNPTLAMEYLSESRGNVQHREAVNLLKELQYKTYIIDQQGLLKPIDDIEHYLEENKLESDNIILKK
jgi:FkbM family methyltransferase